jgi:DNA-binding NarL/FixJ family response regulator
MIAAGAHVRIPRGEQRLEAANSAEEHRSSAEEIPRTTEHAEQALCRLRSTDPARRMWYANACSVAGAQALNETTTYRLVIADDHPLFRGALREAVSGLLPRAEIAEAGSFEEVGKQLDQGGEVDLVLLDLTMPGVRGFSGLMYLRAQYPSVPIVVVSASDDPAVIRRCMEFGASGFLPKTLSIEAMRAAISLVLEGGVWTPPDVNLQSGSDAGTAELVHRLATLTPQQVRVLMMLSEGLLNKQIAYELGVSEATIKAHVSAILQKLGVESRTQAVIAAAKIEAGHWPTAVAND